MPQSAVTFVLIFLAVLAIVGLAVWLVSRFGKNRMGSNANRGRMPRLAVIDAATVDARRRLVLVRRDNVEHLLMIGGPSDVVIEPNIVRAVPQRDQMPPRGPVGAELPPRVAPLPDATSWSDAPLDGPDHHEPMLPDLPPRPVRPSFADEVRRPSPSIAERRGDPLAAEPPARPEPPVRSRPLPRSEAIPRSEPLISRGEPSIPRGEPAMPRSEPLAPRSEPLVSRAEPIMPRSAPPPLEPAVKAPPPRAAERPVIPAAPPPLSAADQNLAEMAQRLEAALRKPSEPAAERAPPVAPEAPSRPAARPTDISVNPPPRSDTPAPPVAPPGPKATSFENLEDEMASLLGRPKSPT